MDLSQFTDAIFDNEPDNTVHVGDYEFKKYEMNPEDFIGRTCIWYGATKSGKSFHLNYVLYNVRHYFPRVIVFCPTGELNHDYKGKVDDCMVYTDLTEEMLININQAQEEVSDTYVQFVQNIKYLREVFDICASDKQRGQMQTMEQTLAEVINRIKVSNDAENIKSQNIKNVKDNFESQIRDYMKSIITAVRNTIKIDRLTPGAQKCVRYIDLNPNVLFIFDDCQNELSRLYKKKNSPACKILEDFCTRGRHRFTSVYFTCQDDSALPPPIRKGAHVSVLTQSGVASSFLGRDTSGLTPLLKKRGQALVSQLFQGPDDHRKIIHFREGADENRFQYHVADLTGEYTTMSKLINKFCIDVAVN